MDVPNKGLKIIKDQVKNLNRKADRVKRRKKICKILISQHTTFLFIPTTIQAHNRLKTEP